METNPPFDALTGACRCGQARLRIDSAPIITHACHCRSCQRTSGSAFQTFVMIETDRVMLVEGQTREIRLAKNHKRIECPDCGCALWLHRKDLGDVIAFVGVGVLDQAERLTPEAHYFVRFKHPWIRLPPTVPAFEELGDPGKAGFRARIGAALATAKSKAGTDHV